MHILISNDDGVLANGIRALAKEAVKRGHKVTIYAPDTQRSAASHSATFFRSLHVEPVEYADDIKAYAVDGTPADCVRLGLYIAAKEAPVDCVLSGINNGANRGAAILYSGTVAAATEAALCGYPAVAVSLCSYADEGYETAARLGVKAAEWAVKHRLPRGEIYNLNVPKGEVKGIKSATVSYEFMSEPLYDCIGENEYMIPKETQSIPETDENSDWNVTHDGYAALSVITWNRLSSTPMPELSQFDAEFEQK